MRHSTTTLGARRRKAIAVLAVAGFAAGAQAQAIHINVANPTLQPGESTTITLSASYGAGDYAVAGIATDLVDLTEREGFSELMLIAPMDGPGTSAGTLVVEGVEGIVAGQLNFPPASIYADPTNPIAFWQTTFTLGHITSRTILELETRTTRFDVYTDMMSGSSESRLDDLVEGQATIALLPAPGATAVLGLGLLAMGRRRR